MFRRILLAACLLSSLPGFAREKAENWIEVRSEHFVVATNSNEKEGRRVADQFERMRSVFQVAFPNLVKESNGAVVIVLAVKEEKDFRALEPAVYLAKGSIRLGGLFLRTPDKNYVLMDLDARGDHPYETIYHEYTHMLMSKAAEWMPLWMNEGLAEFYGNTNIHEKEIRLGEANADSILYLRDPRNRLLPLTTLFAVDYNSPYYHQEDKGSIFYAQSWALTHYLIMKDFQQNTHKLRDYANLLIEKVDPVTAGQQAFGDLKQLDDDLSRYVQQVAFSAFKMPPATTQVDQASFKAQPLSEPQTEALRADFLAYTDRSAEAPALLEDVLKKDPNNASAYETKGFLAFQQGHQDEARKYYAQAVQYDSQSYLAHYYFAAMSMIGALAPSDEEQVEKSLRAAIKLNPSFAPTYDRLAVLLAMQHRNLDEAHMMGLTAITLEPGNIQYRVNVANVLLEMQQANAAVYVLRAAAKLAKTPQEEMEVENRLMNAQEYAASQQEAKNRVTGEAKVGAEVSSTVVITSGAKPPALAPRDTFVAKGPHKFVTGVLKNVHCDTSTMDLTVDAAGKLIALHSENYYKIEYSTLNFKPSGDLKPCQDMEGRPAKVEYVESADTAATPRVLAVELHK